jgi:hypothetical protein
MPVLVEFSQTLQSLEIGHFSFVAIESFTKPGNNLL